MKDHEEYQKFKCNNCCKDFVTEWRLNKHRKIHDGRTKKYCNNFKTGKTCPFQELGCKFLHIIPDTKVINTTSWKSMTQSLDDSFGSFFTSTPRKPYEDCDECKESSNCTDCIVKHILGQHACAKLVFS